MWYEHYKNTARFLKYVWPFVNSLHERVNMLCGRECCLGHCQTYGGNIFSKIVNNMLAINYFRKKIPSYIFDKALNTPLYWLWNYIKGAQFFEVNNKETFGRLTTILVMFWNFIRFTYWFYSPQAKLTWYPIWRTLYGLRHKLPNDLRLRI